MPLAGAAHEEDDELMDILPAAGEPEDSVAAGTADTDDTVGGLQRVGGFGATGGTKGAACALSFDASAGDVLASAGGGVAAWYEPNLLLRLLAPAPLAGDESRARHEADEADEELRARQVRSQPTSSPSLLRQSRSVSGELMSVRPSVEGVPTAARYSNSGV